MQCTQAPPRSSGFLDGVLAGNVMRTSWFSRHIPGGVNRVTKITSDPPHLLRLSCPPGRHSGSLPPLNMFRRSSGADSVLMRKMSSEKNRSALVRPLKTRRWKSGCCGNYPHVQQVHSDFLDAWSDLTDKQIQDNPDGRTKHHSIGSIAHLTNALQRTRHCCPPLLLVRHDSTARWHRHRCSPSSALSSSLADTCLLVSPANCSSHHLAPKCHRIGTS